MTIEVSTYFTNTETTSIINVYLLYVYVVGRGGDVESNTGVTVALLPLDFLYSISVQQTVPLLAFVTQITISSYVRELFVFTID